METTSGFSPQLLTKRLNLQPAHPKDAVLAQNKGCKSWVQKLLRSAQNSINVNGQKVVPYEFTMRSNLHPPTTHSMVPCPTEAR
jgi:hypothetical protein